MSLKGVTECERWLLSLPQDPATVESALRASSVQWIATQAHRTGCAYRLTWGLSIEGIPLCTLTFSYLGVVLCTVSSRFGDDATANALRDRHRFVSIESEMHRGVIAIDRDLVVGEVSKIMRIVATKDGER
jgi:hypothetical protein